MTALLLSAFAAGMVSTVNPCGFAMLPAYLGIFLRAADGERASSPIYVGLAVSAGFVAVFVLAGILITAGLRALVSWIPWLAAGVGLGLVGVGVAELRGVHVLSRLPQPKRAWGRSSLGGLSVFGASFGVASLSCTMPIFLSLVAGAVAGRSFVQAASVFLVYGLGMSLVVVVLTLGLAAGRDRVLRVIRHLSAHLTTIAGWILILAGGFVIWYWATVLSSGSAELAGNPIVSFIDRATATVANLVSSNPIAVALAAVAIGVVAWMSYRRRAVDREDPKPADEGAGKTTTGRRTDRSNGSEGS